MSTRLGLFGEAAEEEGTQLQGQVQPDGPCSTCEPVVQYAMNIGVDPDAMLVDSAIPPLSKPVLQLVTASQGIAPSGDWDNDSDLSASSAPPAQTVTVATAFLRRHSIPTPR